MNDEQHREKVEQFLDHTHTRGGDVKYPEAQRQIAELEDVLRREAFNEWWSANVKNTSDWDYWTERIRAGEVKAVKVRVEVCHDQ